MELLRWHQCVFKIAFIDIDELAIIMIPRMEARLEEGEPCRENATYNTG